MFVQNEGLAYFMTCGGVPVTYLMKAQSDPGQTAVARVYLQLPHLEVVVRGESQIIDWGLQSTARGKGLNPSHMVPGQAL